MHDNKFSADRATFFFSEKRADKNALWRLGFVYVFTRFVILALILLLTVPYLLNVVPDLLALNPDSSQFLLKFQSISNFYQVIGLVAGLVFLPVFTAIYTALLRWMLFGESDDSGDSDDSGGKWFGLRFGAQEINVLVVFIAVTVVLLLGMLLSLIPVAILIGVIVGIAKASSTNALMAIAFLIGFIWVCAIIWFAVRMSPAMALTVKRGKIQVFEAFAVSKGHFWQLFLAYILQFFIVLALALGVTLIALLVSLPFLGIGLAMFGWGEPSMANVGAYIGLALVPVLVLTLTGLALEYLSYAMGAGISACLVGCMDEEDRAPTSTPTPPPFS